MWTINRIDHVVVWVRDLGKSMAFYEALGFVVDQGSLAEHRAGRIPFVAVKAGPNNQIDLRPDPEWVPLPRGKGNMQHLNIAIDGIENIQVLVDQLAARGITPDHGPEIQGGSWRIDIYDPDNNRIEVALNVPA